MGSFIRFVNIVVVSVMEMVVGIVGGWSRFEYGEVTEVSVVVGEGYDDGVAVGVWDIVVIIVEA